MPVSLPLCVCISLTVCMSVCVLVRMCELVCLSVCVSGALIKVDDYNDEPQLRAWLPIGYDDNDGDGDDGDNQIMAIRFVRSDGKIYKRYFTFSLLPCVCFCVSLSYTLAL